MSPRIALSIGCPSGIGPEVAVVAAAEARVPVLLVGDAGVIERAAKLRRIRLPTVVVESAREGFASRRGKALVVWQPTTALALRDARPGTPSRAGGAAQLAWIDAACDLVREGAASALVTGPVSKEAIARSGAPGSAEFLGHTEHLARRLRARSVVMSFVSDALTTALVTTHIPLSEVAGAIDAEGVANAAVHLARLIAALRKRANGDVRIAIASLNPHAGEGGLLGHEESRAIVPGIALARKRLLGARIHPHLEGPVPAETAFRRAANGGYHGVVAMYHDQATIPMKCLAFGDAVNVTLGLPIVRTSVDHGTGYDIAGKGIADAEGMQNAIALGAKLAKSGLVTDAAR